MSAMSEARGSEASGRSAWTAGAVLVGVLASIYMISQFFRNSIGVIGPDLAREFDLDAGALSLLASIFFLSFAAVQIPLGMAIDRFGPRAVILATAGVVIAGAVYFAAARGFGDLVAARLVIGLGCSSFLMAPLAMYASRFPPQRFSSIVGLHVGAGNIGSLAATAPLAFAAATIGWRGAFGLVAAVACIAAALVFLLVREAEEARARRAAQRESARDLIAGVVEAVRTPWFARIFLLHLASYPAFAAILGLWSGPWLSHVYGMPVEARGKLLLAMVIGQILGLFVWGSADRWFRGYKTPVAIASVGCIVALALPAVATLPEATLLPYMFALGFVFGFLPLLTAHGRSLFPDRLIGRGLSLMNIASIGGVFLLQIVTGLLIGLFAAQVVDGARVYPPEAYRLVFGFLALQLAAALAAYLSAPDAQRVK
jgi:predicted MFS family arabinose efflux permease